MQYLEPDQHYINRYDLGTIRHALDVVDVYQKTYQRCLVDREYNETPSTKRNHLNRMLYDKLFFVLTERYEHKNDKLKEWMNGDRKQQNKYDDTPAPDVRCVCGAVMNSTFKDLQSSIDDKNLRMLFFFNCPQCKKRKVVYEDGEEWMIKPRLCPKCKKKIKETVSRKGDAITTVSKCRACGYIKKEVDDFTKSHAKWEAEQAEAEKKDNALLEKYRPLFCLTDEQGKAALDQREALEVAEVICKEEREKYDSPAYAEASQLKRLNIADLERLLSEPLTKKQYIKFSLDKPEDGPNFVVPFSVQDADSSRASNSSSYDLRKLLEGLLKDTNWRLMNGHISNRLGYLSGRIRGYEREEDLMELYKQNQPQKEKFKITEEMRQKHAYNRWVRLAKMSGEFKGVENTRKRRLEKEPEGFFLEDSEGGNYSCGICGQAMPGSRAWWNLDGLRCADCWMNIKKGVIPSLTWENRDTWMRDFQIDSDYSVHPATRRMLVRKGVLKGRDLNDPNGDVYCTVYLASENAEFLKKYPKKPRIEVDFDFPWVKEGVTVDPDSVDASK